MNSVKSWAVMVAIAAAINLQVAAGEHFILVCHRLDKELLTKSKPTKLMDMITQSCFSCKKSELDGEKAFAFARNYIEEHADHSSAEYRLLIKALEDIYKGEECSESSWEYLQIMNECKSQRSLKFLDEPTRAYSKKCLKPEYVKRKLKNYTPGIPLPKIEFLDADFIKKFYHDNPNDPPFRVSGQDCCRPKRSFGAVNDAIRRDFAKHSGDANGKFFANEDAVVKYLNEKLLRPCDDLRLFFAYLTGKMWIVPLFYEGGEQALIASLDQEMKDILFRAKYCRMLVRDEPLVLGAVEREFVQSVSHPD